MGISPESLFLLEHKKRVNEQLCVSIQNGIEPIIRIASSNVVLLRYKHSIDNCIHCGIAVKLVLTPPSSHTTHVDSRYSQIHDSRRPSPARTHAQPRLTEFSFGFTLTEKSPWGEADRKSVV